MKTILFLLYIGCFIMTSCTTSRSVTVTEDGIPTASVQSEKVDSATIAQLTLDIEAGIYPNYHSLLIARNNKLVFEKYWTGMDWIYDHSNNIGTPGLVSFSKNTLHSLRSISKSIVSACIGIAIKQGKIKSVDQRVFDFFPEYARLDTGLKSLITIKHLLTMTAGLMWREFVPDSVNYELIMNASAYPVHFILKQPMEHNPGTVWNYSGGATQLLATIIEKTTGKKIDSFAKEYLFDPLEIKEFEWMKNSAGVPAASWGLLLRPRDMLKFGLLYLNNGKWRNKQILPAKWVEESLQSHVRINDNDAGGGYGFQFWIWSSNITGQVNPIFAAMGNGDQNIFFDTVRHLLVVTTAGNYDKSNTKDLFAMLQEYIYPALFK